MAEVSFGEWLKRRRNAVGLTQEQLALQINCSTSALRKFEAEVRRPSADVIEQMAKIFNIPQEERKAFLRFARGDWQAISDGDQDTAPWHGSAIQVEKQLKEVTPKHNLPLQLTTFIGREKEQDEITNLVMKDRLVTLTGTGGIGKSRLSIQTGLALIKDFPNGMWLIEFAPLSDPALVPQIIVSTLGLIEQENRPPQTILTDFLQARKSLLILDNCEHLIQTCAQLADVLLRSCPDLHVLATSREALGISGETVYLVPSLTLPHVTEAAPENLAHYEAVQLFIERAQTALPGFAMTRGNASAIAQVCQHLDGIPLAIELAAARVKLLNVEEIAERLDDTFRLLIGGARTALPHHRTLHAMIDWSHELLSESERMVFRRLSIFAGGWTLEAAESVCTDAGQDAVLSRSKDGILSHQVFDILTSLVNKSLIVAERKDGQETRYHMLETIRQYAHEKLWKAGEGESVRQRHLAYFVELAERAEPNLRSFDMVSWLDQLEAEHDNLRSGLQYAQESDIQSQLRLASALLWFWHIRGHKNEGIEWLERALFIESLDRDSQPITPDRALLRGKALNASGSLMVMNHEFGRASVRLEESLALFKELGPTGRQGMAYALLRLGSLQTGNDRAGNLLEQSLTIFREIGDKFGAAECLIQLAGTAQTNDNLQQAERFVEEQLALSREIGDHDGAAVALTNLGDIAFSEDNYQKATILYEQAFAGFRTVRNTGAESLSLAGYGDIFFWQGNYKQAAKIYEESLSLAHNLGYTFLVAFNLYNLGAVAWSQGDHAHAAQLIAESRPMFRNVGYHWLAASSLHALGDIALAEGDDTRAAPWYEAELAFSRDVQLEVSHVFALDGLGKVAWSQGDYELATKRFEEVLKISREANIKPAMFHALYHLGKMAQTRGDIVAARAWYVKALELQRQRVGLLYRWAGLKTYQSAIAYPVAALALLAVMQNNLHHATRLFGSAERLYPPLRFEMSAREHIEHDQAIASARAAQGEEEFSRIWNEGQKMSLDVTVAYAMKVD